MTELYQNYAIRQLEKLAIEAGIDEDTLMARAGQAAFEVLRETWPQALQVIVCCGKGNNGGDGYVVARHCHQAGFKVIVSSMCDVNELTGAAKQAAEQCEEVGVKIAPYHELEPLHADVIVDALLGSGLKGEVRGPYEKAIEAINASAASVLAIDVPSGLDVDTGQILGDAVQADATITFIGRKPGLYTNKGPAYCGELHCNDLDIAKSLFTKIKITGELMDWQAIERQLPRRRRDAHKGDYGHVLVVGGDYGMGGAVRMAAEAALRVGAGLVTVATRPEHVSVVSGQRPELMCHQVAGAKDLQPLLERSSVIVVGPGLGKSDWAKELLNKLLESKLPKLLDADALNILSTQPQKRDDWILTPHPGEASRLLDISSQEVQDDRFAAARRIHDQYGGTVVLKGAGTIIQCDQPLPIVCPAGNPGMATGGMGDILSGIIGGMLAQHLDLAVAAQCGVFIHSKAADLAAAEGGERGLLATDLMTHLRGLVNPSV
jgi:ADP-dependent NAD(P)H-hydrate dehydratase / NAD(P)H-hydrate epimerase